MEVVDQGLPAEWIPRTPTGIERRLDQRLQVGESPLSSKMEREELEDNSPQERSELHHEDLERNAADHETSFRARDAAQDEECVAETVVPNCLPGIENSILAEKYQDKCSEFEDVEKECEIQRKQGDEEPENKYESLMRKYTEECFEKEAALKEASETRRKCEEECGPKYENLMKKYTEECLERKRLYNELVEMKGNIRVFCRCRPLAREEALKGISNVFEFDALQETEMNIICSDSSRKHFKFDRVFGPSASQESVFAETLPIIKSALDGFNACIFAYGQTGSGKTFTMEGTEENRGVNYRTLEELFRLSRERSMTTRYEFSVSILEVYNEKIRDLLVDSSQQGKKLEIKLGGEGTQEVPGLTEAQTCSIEDVWDLLGTGRQNRSVGATNANELSSRSHFLFRVSIKGENLANGQKSKSNLWLVDLAGSERVGKIEVEGERLKESQFINKSLSALGDVISALASRNSHIPYRNSKLTHLLQSSLGGDCKTLMFVQISPSSADIGESLCSLNFATRVRGIEQGPARKQLDPAESFKCKQLVEKLRQEEKEKAKLNESLQLMHIKYASRENVFKALQDKIKDLENQLAEERRILQQQHGSQDLASTKFHRPPLPPIKERLPLRRIAGNIVPVLHRRNSIATTTTTSAPSVQEKENFLSNRAQACSAPLKAPPLKARRVLLAAPVNRSGPARRASIATTFASYNSRSNTNLRQNYSNSRIHHAPLTKLSWRRRSLLSSHSTVPSTPVALSTPIDGERSSCSSSKFCSPPQNLNQRQHLFKSKIPTIASPRRRIHLLQAMPGSGGKKISTPGSKQLCFSIQKRLAIGSPTTQLQQPGLFGMSTSTTTTTNQVVSRNDILSGPRRIPCKNSYKRRVSVA